MAAREHLILITSACMLGYLPTSSIYLPRKVISPREPVTLLCLPHFNGLMIAHGHDCHRAIDVMVMAMDSELPQGISEIVSIHTRRGVGMRVLWRKWAA